MQNKLKFLPIFSFRIILYLYVYRTIQYIGTGTVHVYLYMVVPQTSNANKVP